MYKTLSLNHELFYVSFCTMLQGFQLLIASVDARCHVPCYVRRQILRFRLGLNENSFGWIKSRAIVNLVLPPKWY